jgi:hypothetical protein
MDFTVSRPTEWNPFPPAVLARQDPPAGRAGPGMFASKQANAFP